MGGCSDRRKDAMYVLNHCRNSESVTSEEEEGVEV